MILRSLRGNTATLSKCRGSSVAVFASVCWLATQGSTAAESTKRETPSDEVIELQMPALESGVQVFGSVIVHRRWVDDQDAWNEVRFVLRDSQAKEFRITTSRSGPTDEIRLAFNQLVQRWRDWIFVSELCDGNAAGCRGLHVFKIGAEGALRAYGYLAGEHPLLVGPYDVQFSTIFQPKEFMVGKLSHSAWPIVRIWLDDGGDSFQLSLRDTCAASESDWRLPAVPISSEDPENSDYLQHLAQALLVDSVCGREARVSGLLAVGHETLPEALSEQLERAVKSVEPRLRAAVQGEKEGALP